MIIQEPTAEDHDRVVEEMQAVQTDLRTYTPVVFQITVPNASGDVDFTVAYKVKVIDTFAMKTAANGGAGDTVTVKNGSTAISNAMSLNINCLHVQPASMTLRKLSKLVVHCVQPEQVRRIVLASSVLFV